VLNQKHSSPLIHQHQTPTKHPSTMSNKFVCAISFSHYTSKLTSFLPQDAPPPSYPPPTHNGSPAPGATDYYQQPYGSSPSPSPAPYGSQQLYAQPAYGAQPQQQPQPYYQQQQQGPYGPPQGGMMYGQQPPPPQGYYANGRGQKQGGAGEGLCAGLLGLAACCCCLDFLF